MATNTMKRVRQLWRIELPEQPPSVEAEAQLADGLRLHVAHDDLDTILVRAGDTQQSYIGVSGCPGCARGSCEPGCRSDMLRRLLERCLPGVQLRRTPGGLAERPYTRLLLATPRADSVPLRGDLLHRWPESRMVQSWRRASRGCVFVSLLLAVAEPRTDPRELLTQDGWRVWPLPELLTRRLMHTPLPSAPRMGQALPLIPALLRPEPIPRPEERQPAQGDPFDMSLAAWGRSLFSTGMLCIPYPLHPRKEVPSPWPAGPGTLAPAALGTLVAQLITEPSFQSERKGQSGLSKGRLAKHAGLSENAARALMVWFDRAGVLAPPEDGQGLWRAPRPFALTDLEQIAAKLHDTPLPTGEEIRAAYGGEV